MIEEAAVWAARFDRACGGGGEVSEAGIGPIDAGERLAQFAPQVRCDNVELAACCVQQHLAPPERRQTPARAGHAVDQGPRVGCERAEPRPYRDGADAQRRAF
jgi:hypothetical protein